jgi:hypothetical protein
MKYRDKHYTLAVVESRNIRMGEENFMNNLLWCSPATIGQVWVHGELICAFSLSGSGYVYISF